MFGSPLHSLSRTRASCSLRSGGRSPAATACPGCRCGDSGPAWRTGGRRGSPGCSTCRTGYAAGVGICKFKRRIAGHKEGTRGLRDARPVHDASTVSFSDNCRFGCVVYVRLEVLVGAHLSGRAVAHQGVHLKSGVPSKSSENSEGPQTLKSDLRHT